MSNKTKTTEILGIVILLVLTLALTAGAVYQAQHRQNVRDAAVVKAQHERDTARQESVTDRYNLQAAQAQVQTVTAQKVQLCNVLTAHKLTDNACK